MGNKLVNITIEAVYSLSEMGKSVIEDEFTKLKA
jgi:hypothetical protein